ncbi:MAG: polysaccharide pyruvyl transferase family protein [Nitrospinae bacterium]|nr:polysaccharide pyruvyl transferase family protein [Nitrospinota bacterium]
MRILYTSYLGFSNLGDDLCLEEFASIANNRGGVEVMPLVPDRAGTDQRRFIVENVAGADAVVVGGGSLLTYDFYLTVAVEAGKQGKPVYFWGSGIDGASENTAMSIANGDRLEDASIGAVNVELLKTAVDNATGIFVRGPVTRDILTLIHPSFIRARIAGDPGFLVEPERSADHPIFHAGRPVLMVNWGVIDNEGAGYGGGDGLVQAERFFEALRRLAGEYALLLFPMIPRDNQLHERWAQELSAQGAQVEVDETVGPASRVAGLMSKSVAVIGRKLHAQVLAATAGAPFVGLAYRAKCFDFAASTDSMDYTLSTGDPDLAGRVVELTARAVARREEIVERLSAFRRIYRARLMDAAGQIFSGVS